MSIHSLEVSFNQDQLEHLDASAASKSSPRSQGVLESKGGSTEPPSSTVDSATPILSIRHRVVSIVNHELEKMVPGEIKELSWQCNSTLQQLASLKVSSSSASATLSESDPSNPVPVQSVPTYAGVLSAPKAITFTPNDVRSLRRLYCSADADVAEVLSQIRLGVGFRVNAENIKNPGLFTTVSACVSECSRSTQRPRRTSLSVMGGVRPDNNIKRQLRGTARCWHANPILFFVLFISQSADFGYLFFSSRRVQISGSVDDYLVPAITVDTATDMSVVSHA